MRRAVPRVRRAVELPTCLYVRHPLLTAVEVLSDCPSIHGLATGREWNCLP